MSSFVVCYPHASSYLLSSSRPHTLSHQEQVIRASGNRLEIVCFKILQNKFSHTDFILHSVSLFFFSALTQHLSQERGRVNRKDNQLPLILISVSCLLGTDSQPLREDSGRPGPTGVRPQTGHPNHHHTDPDPTLHCLIFLWVLPHSHLCDVSGPAGQ